MKKSGESNLFLGILTVAVVLTVVALKPVLFPGKDAFLPPPPLVRKDLLPPGTRIQGNPKAPYVLIEFGEYQCPMCLSVMKPTEELVEQHRDKLAYVFNYTTVMHGEHKHAELLAMACEAADQQGKYLEMHHALFQELRKFTNAKQDQVIAEITRIAASLGMDVLELRAAIASKEVSDAIDRQIAIGRKAKVQLTPSFYIVMADGTAKSLGGFEAMKKWIADPGNMQ
jgi:protein-disulfide isomerase